MLEKDLRMMLDFGMIQAVAGLRVISTSGAYQLETLVRGMEIFLNDYMDYLQC